MCVHEGYAAAKVRVQVSIGACYQASSHQVPTTQLACGRGNVSMGDSSRAADLQAPVQARPAQSQPCSPPLRRLSGSRRGVTRKEI